MAGRPKDMSRLPALKWGEGSWGYDEHRRKLTLRHRWEGKAYTERGETPEECLARQARRRRDVTLWAGKVGDGSLASLLAAWASYQGQGRAHGTIEGYAWTTRHVLAQLGANVRVADLTVTDIETMYEALALSGLSGRSLAKVQSHLKMALDFGVRRNMLPVAAREELRRAITPSTAPRPRKRRWFDLADYQTVRAYLTRPDAKARDALFLTMLLCGLRPSEALGMRWEYIDLEARLLSVEGHIERHRRDVPEALAYTQRLKTDYRHDRAHRTIPIPLDLARSLARLPRSDGFTFIEDSGHAKGRRMATGMVYPFTCTVAGEARVPRINANGYRHTFASVCRHNGMPYELLAKLMGHKDATMIIRTYGHPIKDATPLDLDRYLGTEAEDDGDAAAA